MLNLSAVKNIDLSAVKKITYNSDDDYSDEDDSGDDKFGYESDHKRLNLAGSLKINLAGSCGCWPDLVVSFYKR